MLINYFYNWELGEARINGNRVEKDNELFEKKF